MILPMRHSNILSDSGIEVARLVLLQDARERTTFLPRPSCPPGVSLSDSSPPILCDCPWEAERDFRKAGGPVLRAS